MGGADQHPDARVYRGHPSPAASPTQRHSPTQGCTVGPPVSSKLERHSVRIGHHHLQLHYTVKGAKTFSFTTRFRCIAVLEGPVPGGDVSSPACGRPPRFCTSWWRAPRSTSADRSRADPGVRPGRPGRPGRRCRGYRVGRPGAGFPRKSPMLSCLVVQHVEPECPFAIADALRAAGVHVDVRRVFAGEALPADLDGFSAVVAMGGPMSVTSDAGFPTRRRRSPSCARRSGAACPHSGCASAPSCWLPPVAVRSTPGRRPRSAGARSSWPTPPRTIRSSTVSPQR